MNDLERSQLCPTCVRKASNPFRVYDPRGKVTMGCIDEFHSGHLVTPSESSFWHNRPIAKKHRSSVKRHLKNLSK